MAAPVPRDSTGGPHLCTEMHTPRPAPTETEFSHSISQPLPGKDGGECGILFVTGLFFKIFKNFGYLYMLQFFFLNLMRNAVHFPTLHHFPNGRK